MNNESSNQSRKTGFKAHSSSFRDPDGFIFKQNDTIYRCVNASMGSDGHKDYEKLMSSGLYKELMEKRLLVRHEETDEINMPPDCKYILKPEFLPFISYPYEWSFGQLQQAARLTLDILTTSLDYGMILKDASAYNVTWHKGKPIFIDTLSFTAYQEGQAWLGYRQFCSHFLAPLALMQYTNVGLQKLLQTNLDGIPLDLASSLLPWRTRLSVGMGIHMHMHARSQKKYAGVRKKVSVKVPLKTLRNLAISLLNVVDGLKPRKADTEWGGYYNDTNYSPEQQQEKEKIISTWVDNSDANTVFDLGANDGTFSRVAAQSASLVISADIDPMAVQANYVRCRTDAEARILPLLLDITTPSPGIGWLCRERESIFDRLKPDLGMALALIHHLAIGANLPLNMIMEAFARLAPRWIVEFVDKPDSQVQRLLANREDVFPNYTQSDFEAVAAESFHIEAKHPICDMYRTLYLLRAKREAR